MKHSLLIGVTGACCLATITAVSVTSLRNLNASDAGEKRLASVRSSISNLQRLQSLRSPTLGAREPDTGLGTQVSDTLMRVGLPVSTMSSLAPDTETSLNSTLRKRTFRLSLQPVRLPELGRFLSDWRMHHPEWRAVSMQCTPQQLDPKQPIARTSEVPAPIAALIVFEAVYAPAVSRAKSISGQPDTRPIPDNSAPLLR